MKISTSLPLNELVEDQPIPAGDCVKKKTKHRVKFNTVDVFQFGWAQGIDTVPDRGGVSLGMEYRHHTKHTFRLDEYSVYKRAENSKKYAIWRGFEAVLLAALEKEKDNTNKNKKQEEITNNNKQQLLTPIKNRKRKTIDEISPCEKRPKLEDKTLKLNSSGTSSDGNVEENDGGKSCFDEYHVFEPLRQYILKKSGVSIEKSVTDESKQIVKDRQFCGCTCEMGKCLPDKCQCSLEGINCQVDIKDGSIQFGSFPCSCTRAACRNPEGRIEFDAVRVQNHFLQTLMRIRAVLKKGLDVSQGTHSPQHIIFKDDDGDSH